MSVRITDLCINCDACIEECPATAIVSADESPLADGEFTYVKPEKCIECVDSTVPKCADVCPTEGCIVWDMPYTEEFDEYYVQGHEDGTYLIRTHKKKGLLSPANQPRPFRETITTAQREDSIAVEV
jgi:ferredoxin